MFESESNGEMIGSVIECNTTFWG